MTDPLAAIEGPALRELVQAVLSAWPQHEKFLRQSFADRSPRLNATSERIAALLAAVSAHSGRPLALYAEDYRHLCEKIVYPEEMFFRREGRYRLSTFAEAAAEVYDNAELMARYMNGLFASDALWLNHASAIDDFASLYLPTTARGGRHLEIGPGHGMLLHLALECADFRALSAWDVSATSIAHTREVLDIVGAAGRVALALRNLYDADALAGHRGAFDAVVLSEVLEHLEQPLEALVIIRDLLAEGGTVWINVPLNGPAPDHLFLLRSPDEAAALVASAGLEVERIAAYPMAGVSLERAIRQELPVSCCLVARRLP